MQKSLKADFILVAVTFFWGISYLMMDITLRELDPFTLNAYRFLAAFVIAYAVSYKKMKNVSFATIKSSILLGAILTVVYFGATYGVKYTSLSNAGFLCALTVVFTPIFEAVFLGKKTSKKLIFVVSLSLIGIALLTLNDELKPAIGDLLCILCAIAYAWHLIVMERSVKKSNTDAFHIGVFQLAFTGIFMLILSLVFETPKLPESTTVWFAVLFLTIFCTGLAFIAQAVAQQYTSPSHVGVIFTLEPVFAGTVAFIFVGEILTARGYLGALLLMLSLFIMEVDIPDIFKLKKAS